MRFDPTRPNTGVAKPREGTLVGTEALLAYAKASVLGTQAPPVSNHAHLEMLVASAGAQNCLPIIAANLRTVPFCPAALAQQCDRIAAKTWAIHMMTAAALGPVFAQAAEEGLTVVVYKGAAQAVRYYAQPAARSMADVDILVREEQKQRLYEILTRRAFRVLVTPGREFTGRVSHERTYCATTPGTRCLDVHTFPAPPTRYRLPVAGMIERSVPGTLFDAPVRFLSAEDELVVMATNQAYDHFRMGFLRYLDAWLLSTNNQIDWDVVADRSIAAGCATATWLTLSNARRVAQVDIPPNILARLCPSTLRRWWLGLLLDNQGLGAPRFSLPRRVEQLLLVFPVVDRPRAFLRFLTIHTGLRILDAVKSVIDELRRRLSAAS